MLGRACMRALGTARARYGGLLGGGSSMEGGGTLREVRRGARARRPDRVRMQVSGFGRVAGGWRLTSSGAKEASASVGGGASRFVASAAPALDAAPAPPA